MKFGKSSPYYGQLMTKNLSSEVKKIWYSRHDELEELPRWQWSFEMHTDTEQLDRVDLITKILEQTPLTDREEIAIMMIVIGESTLDEVGQELGVTRERARQIFMKGIRRLRNHQKKVTGDNVYSLDCEVTTWNRYSRMQQEARRQA